MAAVNPRAGPPPPSPAPCLFGQEKSGQDARAPRSPSPALPWALSLALSLAACGPELAAGGSQGASSGGSAGSGGASGGSAGSGGASEGAWCDLARHGAACLGPPVVLDPLPAACGAVALVRDLDGDDVAELVTRRGCVARRTAPGAYAVPPSPPLLPEEIYNGLWSSIAAGDLDGDGVTDAVAAIEVDGATSLRVLWGGPGALAFEPLDLTGTLPPSAIWHPTLVFVEHVTGDSRAELLVLASDAEGEEPLLRALDVRRQGPPALVGSFASKWIVYSFRVGDMTGDGLDDIITPTETGAAVAVHTSAGGTWTRLEYEADDGFLMVLKAGGYPNVSLTRIGRPGMLGVYLSGVPESLCNGIVRAWFTGERIADDVFHGSSYPPYGGICLFDNLADPPSIANIDGESLAITNYGALLSLWCLYDDRIDLCGRLRLTQTVGMAGEPWFPYFSALLEDPDAPGVLMGDGRDDTPILYLPFLPVSESVGP